MDQRDNPYGVAPVASPTRRRPYTSGSWFTTIVGVAYVAATFFALLDCILDEPWQDLGKFLPSHMELTRRLMVSSFVGAVVMTPWSAIVAARRSPRIGLILIAYLSFILWPVTWYLCWSDALGLDV